VTHLHTFVLQEPQSTSCGQQSHEVYSRAITTDMLAYQGRLKHSLLHKEIIPLRMNIQIMFPEI
jgi:hypothetical protein